jgi:hypothetical protein
LPRLAQVCEDVPVSWWLHALPLHTVDDNLGWDWATGVSFAHGLPDHPPPQALPTATQVLAAFTSAGCHGQAWFTLEAGDASEGLRPCPDPAECAGRGGLDLGEVTLRPAGSRAPAERLAAGTPVTAIGFRKPNYRAVLAGVSGLTAAAGPLLILDNEADLAFVVHEGDRVEDLVTHWPW